MTLLKKRYWFVLLGILLVSLFLIYFSITEENKKEAVILANKALQLYSVNNNFPEADRLFKKSLSLDNKNIITHTNYAQMYCVKGDVNKAFMILDKARQYAHFTSVHYFGLGMYADILGNKSKADEFYKKSIQIASDDNIDKILALYFINPNRSLDKFNTIKRTKMNAFIIDYINKNSMQNYIKERLKVTCGQN